MNTPKDEFDDNPNSDCEEDDDARGKNPNGEAGAAGFADDAGHPLAIEPEPELSTPPLPRKSKSSWRV